MHQKSRLRPRRSPQLVPVAAEVLQARALLSAATAAHAAAHHAAVQSNASQTQALAPHGFHVSQNAEITLGSGAPSLLPVNFSISSLRPVVGAKVTAHASAVLTSPGVKETFKATFIGTVQHITPNGEAVDFDILPTGGSIVIKITQGAEHFTATAFPNGTHSEASGVGKKFIAFNATDLFTADSVAPFTNKTIKFDLTTL
jgi:hypothetical protein